MSSSDNQRHEQKLILLLERASHCNLRGEYQQAETILRQAIQLFPKHPEPYHQLGLLARRFGHLKESAALLSKAVKIKPNSVEYMNDLGLVFHEQGQLKDALARIDAALSIDPSNIAARFNKANIQISQQDFQSAEQTLHNILQRDKNYHLAYNALGVIQTLQNKLEDAEKNLNQAIAIKPDFEDAYVNLSNNYSKQKKHAESLSSADKALSINPYNVNALVNYAFNKYQTAEYEIAQSYIDKALRINANSPKAWKNLVELLMIQQRWQELEQKLHSLLSTGNPDTETRFIACVALTLADYLRGDLAGAREHLLAAKNIPKITSVPFIEYKNWSIYAGYLDSLLSATTPSPPSPPYLYAIGESHSLAPAWQKCTYQQTDYTIHPKLVMGCKAYHFDITKKNGHRQAVESVISSLPANATILLTIGEIDCRIEEGILPVSKKPDAQPRPEIIRSTVAGYIGWIEKMMQNGHNLIIQGVPAPNSRLLAQTYSEFDILEIANLISEFNKELRTATSIIGVEFLDVHALTANQQGLSNQRYHLDAYHLAPTYVVPAFEQFLVKPLESGC